MILAAISQATPEAIRDIAPPVDVFPYPVWVVVLAALLAIALLGGLITGVRLWMRSRPGPPPISPRTKALRDLERLRMQLPQTEPYAFSIAVSDVLRDYIAAAYDLHARQQTSPEFLAAISGTPRFSDDDRQLLARFLERCDLIKFARIDAGAQDNAALLESAAAFVQGGRS